MPNNTYTALPFSAISTAVKYSILSNTVPIILGMPGIGKSSMLRELEDILDSKTFTLQINQIADRTDLIGQRNVEETYTHPDGTVEKRVKLAFFPHYIIQNSIDFALENPDKLSILFMDEINRTSSDVTSATLSVITERTIGGQTLPPNLRIVAAGNDDGNVVALDTASRTRFRFLKAHPDAETILTKVENLNDFIKDIITTYPQLIKQYGSLYTDLDTQSTDSTDDDSFELEFDMDDDGFAQLCVPRTIEYLSKYLNTAHIDKSKSPLSRASFMQHMEQFDNQKSLLQIIIEGSIGTNDFTNKLMDSLNAYYQDILHTTTTQQSITALPAFDHDSFSKIANTTKVDEELTIIDNMEPDTRVNILVSLLLQQNVNRVNDNALVHRTLNNLLIHNDPIPFPLQSALFQITATDPTLLSKSSINQIATNTSQHSLNQIIDALKDAVNY